jgi:hypothetical protein
LRPERTDDFFVAFARVTLRVFDVIFLAAIGHLLREGVIGSGTPEEQTADVDMRDARSVPSGELV